MTIESPAFGQNDTIPSTYTCDGENISPPLRIVDVPDGTKSLALIVDDPDAPGGTFTHWTLWNIDPILGEFVEDSVPAEAVQGVTSFGGHGYGGPCPPSGSHRYFFKAYALSAMLDLAPTADVEELRSAMSEVILAEAELMGRYQRHASR